MHTRCRSVATGSRFTTNRATTARTRHRLDAAAHRPDCSERRGTVRHHTHGLPKASLSPIPGVAMPTGPPGVRPRSIRWEISRDPAMPDSGIDLLAINRDSVTAPAGCGKTHLIAVSVPVRDVCPRDAAPSSAAGVIPRQSFKPAESPCAGIGSANAVYDPRI